MESLRLAFALYEQTKNNKSTKIHYLVTNLIARNLQKNKRSQKSHSFLQKVSKVIIKTLLDGQKIDL